MEGRKQQIRVGVRRRRWGVCPLLYFWLKYPAAAISRFSVLLVRFISCILRNIVPNLLGKRLYNRIMILHLILTLLV
jgi:hypothetical protein